MAPLAAPTAEALLIPSRKAVVGLILAATVLFVVGIIWEKNSGEHHSESVAQAAETPAEHAAESGGSAETTTGEGSTSKANGASSEEATSAREPR